MLTQHTSHIVLDTQTAVVPFPTVKGEKQHAPFLEIVILK